MIFDWQQELIFILRIVIAGLCGFIVGLERKRRFKDAGIRTHFVVAVGACLMVIVGKYGFMSGDPARIAAQVVSGIGFLGAGMIFYRRDALHGLTTAAGVWVTAGIGLAVGAGMYIISVATTLLLVLAHMFFRLPVKLFDTRHDPTIILRFESGEENIKKVKEIFCTTTFFKTKISNDADKSLLTCEFMAGIKLTEEIISQIMQAHPFIVSVEM